MPSERRLQRMRICPLLAFCLSAGLPIHPILQSQELTQYMSPKLDAERRRLQRYDMNQLAPIGEVNSE